MNLYDVLENHQAFSPETAIKGKELAQLLGTTSRNIAKMKFMYIAKDVVASKKHGYFIAKDINDLIHYLRMYQSTIKDMQISEELIEKRIYKRQFNDESHYQNLMPKFEKIEKEWSDLYYKYFDKDIK